MDSILGSDLGFYFGIRILYYNFGFDSWILFLYSFLYCFWIRRLDAIFIFVFLLILDSNFGFDLWIRFGDSILGFDFLIRIVDSIYGL